MIFDPFLKMGMLVELGAQKSPTLVGYNNLNQLLAVPNEFIMAPEGFWQCDDQLTNSFGGSTTVLESYMPQSKIKPIKMLALNYALVSALILEEYGGIRRLTNVYSSHFAQISLYLMWNHWTHLFIGKFYFATPVKRYYSFNADRVFGGSTSNVTGTTVGDRCARSQS